MFSIGLIVYLLSVFFHSGEDDLLDWIVELLGLVGVFAMTISVTIFLWKVLP